MGNAPVKGAKDQPPASAGFLKRSHSSSVGKDTKNARLVKEKFCEALSRQEVASIRKFTSPDSICYYEGAETGMLLPEFLEAVIMMFASFPDNKFVWDSVEEISPGVVLVTNFHGSGTHTGKPFSFGPFPPIAATGIRVKEDPCQLTINVANTKMASIVIDIYSGDLVGPPGYYHKIGGSLKDL
jgi:hypothetical protein